MDNVIQVASGWIFNADRTQVLIVSNIGASWTMPSGGVEEGEFIQDAMVREAFEEVGLHVRINRLMAISEGFSARKQRKVIFFGFLLDQIDPAQKPSIQMPDEIAEIRWVNRDELRVLLPWLPYCPWEWAEQSSVGFYQSVLP